MRVIAWAGTVATAWALGPSPRLMAAEFDGAALYDKCVKSCVFLVIPHKDRDVQGTGTLIDAEQRLVLTCAHLVEGSDTVSAQFPLRDKDGSVVAEKKKYLDRIKGGQALKGKVLHRDPTRDLALVQLDKLPPDTPALPVARTSVKVGETVIKIGTFWKVDSTFSTTWGKVRAFSAVDIVTGHGDAAQRIKARMVTDADAVSWAVGSGGPMLDRRGHLVAVIVSGNFGDRQNVSYAIDVTEVWALLKEKKVAIKEPADEKADPTPKK